jgi:uncharacterized membrane protein YagU involved in acid resistance
MKQWTSLQAILVGGSIAGALDILFAISFAGYNGVPAVRVLQSVASGLLGNAAFAGGAPTAALGLALHFAMALLLASVFWFCARHFALLSQRPILSGVVFGICVFFIMRLVVLPLSAFPRPVTFKPLATTLDLLSHMLLFGVPIALAARQAIARRADPASPV